MNSLRLQRSGIYGNRSLWRVSFVSDGHLCYCYNVRLNPGLLLWRLFLSHNRKRRIFKICSPFLESIHRKGTVDLFPQQFWESGISWKLIPFPLKVCAFRTMWSDLCFRLFCCLPCFEPFIKEIDRWMIGLRKVRTLRTIFKVYWVYIESL